MLRFMEKPDGAFEAMVTGSLEFALEGLGEFEYKSRYGHIHAWFNEGQFDKAIKMLLEAHKSEKLYAPNDYHFFVLDAVLLDYISEHNAVVEDEGRPSKIGEPYLIGEIDWGAVHDIFFWDADYQLKPKHINRLNRAEKKAARFDKALFGVVNKLAPHDDDLVLEEVLEQDHIQAHLQQQEDYYKEGGAYPQ